MPRIAKGIVKDESIFVFDEKDANRLWNKGFFGRFLEGKLYLSLIEGLYLLEKNRIKLVTPRGKSLTYEDLYATSCKKHKNFGACYLVYRDLRTRGYIVKTAFKYGAQFRIYSRGRVPGKDHSDYLVRVVTELSTFEIQDLARAVRLSQSVRKKIWYAVVDNEGDVTYYEIVRITP
jgi:tRNA-intron endonuclease